MAGKWQRDFFLITEDPFAVDFSTLELWVEGYSVREAAELRWNRDFVSTVKQPRGHDKSSRGVTATPTISPPYTTPPSASAVSAVSDQAGGRLSLIAGDPTFHLRLQFMDLLRQDCAQQYEACEFLEDALADPLHFLEFCPVQLELPARRLFIERYYSLDSKCLRELLRNSNVLNIKLQGGGDRKAVAEVEGMARTSGERSLKVARILMNLQRACRWVEQAASQRLSTGGNALSAHQSRSQLTNPANRCYPWARLAIPELEALGEPLCWRYRSLAFVLLHRFDFSSKTLQTLRSEHIEDVAALILACGSIPGSGFPGMLDVLVGGDHETSSSHLNSERSSPGIAASLRQDSVFDPIVREGLRQLDFKVLRPKFNDFKTLVLQQFENRAAEITTVAGFQGASTAVPPVQSDEPLRTGSFAAVSVGRSVFSRFVRLKTARLETVIHALSPCLVCLQSPSEFSIFFNILADFVERLQSVDSAEPLEVFQVCYSAMEQIAEKEQAEVRKAVWPHWLQCWRTFLEFFRAATACALRTEPQASSQVQSKQEKENPNHELAVTSNDSVEVSDRNVSFLLTSSTSLDAEATPPAERRMYMSL